MLKSRLTALAVAALLSVSVVGGALPTAASSVPAGSLDPNLRAHPILQYGALVEPDKKVRVIVQLTGLPSTTHEVDSLAHAFHGNIKEIFPFINTAVVEMAYKDIPPLAAMPIVRYISPDGSTKRKSVDDRDLKNTFDAAAGAQAVWNNTAGLDATGRGVTVALLDSGVNTELADFHRCPAGYTGDFNNCPSVVTTVRVFNHVDNGHNQKVKDGEGHGTHVAGIINGFSPDGQHIGIAPDAHVLSLAISDDNGMAQETDLLRGLEWVYIHRFDQNIRAVNISMAASVPTSYTTSPIDAAVEQLWKGGVAVVASAGNNGSQADATWYAPGNDPFVITVGALDDNGSATNRANDSLASFSSRGLTQDGVYKPDIVAPGRRITSVLSHPDSVIAKMLPDRVSPDGKYIRLSGTSMAAPIVTGTLALILERFPNRTPDQIKGLLVASGRRYAGQTDSAGAVDALHALQLAARGGFSPANQQPIQTAVGAQAAGVVTDMAMTTAYWNTAYWNTAYWNTAYWNTAYWNTAYWNTDTRDD